MPIEEGTPVPVPGGTPTKGAADSLALLVALASGLALFTFGALLRRLYSTGSK